MADGSGLSGVSSTGSRPEKSRPKALERGAADEHHLRELLTCL